MKDKKLIVTHPSPDEQKKEKRGVRIQGPKDCIRLLNRLINKTLNTDDKFELDRLKAVTYATSTLVKVFETSEMEERLKAIEERLEYEKR
jgi:hypothetical protein